MERLYRRKNMQNIVDNEKIIKDWEAVLSRDPLDAPYDLIDETLELLKEQAETIKFLSSKTVEQYGILADLLEVGYPHNFQLEPLYIVDYMQKITKVITKAYNALRNDPEE